VIAEQLLLKLGMPWDGVSPRYLTRGYLERSLGSEGTGRSVGDPDEAIHVAELELFPEGTSYGTKEIVRSRGGSYRIP